MYTSPVSSNADIYKLVFSTKSHIKYSDANIGTEDTEHSITTRNPQVALSYPHPNFSPPPPHPHLLLTPGNH